MSLTFKSNIDISPKLFTSKPSSSSKSSTKVPFVASASSPIEVNFRCKKEASLRLLSSAIREQNTFQRHIFFLALHHHFTALCAWAVKIGRCLFCHCLLQIPSSFYQLCRPRWSSKKEELYNQTRQLIFCKCAWFASLLLTYSTTRRPWHGRTDLPSVVHRVAVSPIKVTFKVSALWIFPDCQMESDMSLLLILLPPHTIFFTRSKNPRFIVGTLVDFFEVLERTRLDSHRGRPSLLHFPRSICHRWTWTREDH